MFDPRKISEALRKKPFEPLQLKFSDGTTETVRHPDNVVVFFSEIGIAQYEKGEEAIAERLKTYALAHLVSIDPIPRAKTAATNGD